MKCVVTGASGHIGNVLIRNLFILLMWMAQKMFYKHVEKKK